MPTQDHWSSAQYQKFRRERLQPFFDLFAMIRPGPQMKIIDLGCGTGEITSMLARQLPGASVLGVDSSQDMLSQTRDEWREEVRPSTLSFQLQDALAIQDFSSYDLVFSHATFQWLPDNEGFLKLILSQLKPGAQIAIQLPQNDSHPSHALAAEVAKEEPFSTWLGGFVRKTHALSLERYAEVLHENGCKEQICIEKIYGHTLESTKDIVEWVKGTLLTAYLGKLTEEQQQRFLAVYQEKLLDTLGEKKPYFYPFRRALFWGLKV